MRLSPIHSIPVLAGLLALGCKGDSGDDQIDSGAPPVELPTPNLDGVDLPAAFQSAFSLALKTDLRNGWAGHVRSMDDRSLGCPDLYAGNPNVDDIDGLPEDAQGWSWRDYCTAQSGKKYGGWAYWDGAMSIEGSAEEAGGKTTSASRTLIGDGLLGQGDSVFYEFDGNGTDSVYLVEEGDYQRWVYSSLVNGTVTGDYAFDPASTETPGGYRTDLYLRASGGDVDSIEARGNLFMLGNRIQERFDSVAMDMAMVGAAGAGPEDCMLEPQGWIGIRDENAFWYDLVFLPRNDDDVTDTGYPNDPYSACDGCGTLYVRGLEQPALEVCMSFDFLWQGLVQPPPVADFVFTLREPGGT